MHSQSESYSKLLTTCAMSLRAVFCALVPRVASLSSSPVLKPKNKMSLETRENHIKT